MSTTLALTQDRPLYRRFAPIGAVLIAVAYVLFHYFMGGLHSVHFLYSGLWLVLYFLTAQSRTYFLIALPVCLHNVIYDAFRYIPHGWLTPIHIKDLHDWDAALFGVKVSGSVVLMHEYFLRFSSPALDVVAGLAYHLLDPMVFMMLFAFWKLASRDVAERYSTAFLAMNVMALTTYLLFPAAAPWYVAQHGFVQPVMAVAGNAAGLANFDHLFGVQLSQQVYSLNPVVFGAMPSMHAGFTMLGWLYSKKLGRAWFIGYGLFALTMWVSALYLQHHYMLDVVMGILYATVAYAVVETVGLKSLRWGYARLFRLLGPARGWLVFGRGRGRRPELEPLVNPSVSDASG